MTGHEVCLWSGRACVYDFHAAIPGWSFEGLWDVLCSDVIIDWGRRCLEQFPGFVLHMYMCVFVHVELEVD